MNFLATNKVWTLGLLALMTLVACGKDNGSDSSIEESTSKTPGRSGGGQTEDAPLAEGPAAILDFVSNSVASVYPSQDQGLLLGDTMADATCSASGLPIHPTAARNTAVDTKSNEAVLAESDVDYASGRFKCFLQKDTGSSASILGTFGEAEMSLCIIDSVLVYDGVERELTVDVASSTCMPQRIKDETLAKGITTVHLTLVANEPAVFGGAGWDRSIEMKLWPEGETEKMTMKILTVQSPEVAGIAVLGGGNPNDAFSVYVDTRNNFLTYESKFQRLADAGWQSHARIRVDGLFDAATGAFVSLDSIQGLYASVNGPVGNSQDIDRALVISSKGTFAPHAIQNRNYYCEGPANCNNNELVRWIERPAHCDGSGCGPGIQLVDDSSLDFIMNANVSKIPVEQWIDQLLPTFQIVTTVQ